MKTLIIINDAPYGTEKAYNALRIANQLNKDHETVGVRIFLIADGVNCVIANQTTPNGFYNIERMLKLALQKGSKGKLLRFVCKSFGWETAARMVNLYAGCCYRHRVSLEIRLNTGCTKLLYCN